jgi:hypothetical protein
MFVACYFPVSSSTTIAPGTLELVRESVTVPETVTAGAAGV